MKYKIRIYTRVRKNKQFEVEANTYDEARDKALELFRTALPNYQTKISSVVTKPCEELKEGK